jgi:hypothetical protein
LHCNHTRYSAHVGSVERTATKTQRAERKSRHLSRLKLGAATLHGDKEQVMARHERLEKCNICNSLRLTTRTNPADPPSQLELFPPQFAHLRDYISCGGGVTAYSTSEFRIDG